ncbi:carotenoid 1,2-hydratase [Vibrio mytili]|uniref:lipocalin-like domain-containing protein n=1 Tax=Vibrio mytili TaxID=50718 RepID=UPI003C6FCB90
MMKINAKVRRFALLLFLTLLLSFAGIAAYSLLDQTDEVHQKEHLPSILTTESNTVFEPVLPDQHVSLPSDFRFHPNYQHEWWNYFAHLKDESGAAYDVQWSFFRVATDERETSGWQNPQLYMSHIVISQGDHVWKKQKIARGGIGQAGVNNRPFRMWIDSWNWRSLGKTPFPGNMKVQTETFGVDLNTTSNGPFVVNGDKGFQVKHALQSVASFSFSVPFLSVNGALNLDGKRIPVKGSAWVQKEWGSGLVGEGQKGWDWLIFNLDDGRALTVSRYRHAGQLPHIFGTLSTRSGQVFNLTENDINITQLQKTKVSQGKRLPLTWIVDIPKYGIRLKTQAVNSEMWLPFAIPFWEGPATASGTHNAWGFMQFIGY